MPKAGQDTNDPNDPNSPYNKVRQNVVTQAGGSADPSAPVAPSAPSTPSPNFTTQPVASAPLPASPTITTQPVATPQRGPDPTTPAPLPPGPNTLPNGAPLPQNGSVIFNPNAPGVTQTGPTTFTQPAIGASGAGGSSASTPGVQNGDYQSWFQNLVKGQPSSYDLITKLAPQLEAQGIKISTNLEGQPSKLILPNGHYISVVDQNGAWRWMDQGTPESNAANPANQGALGINSTSTSSPYADQIRQLLTGQISQLSQPLNVNDPTITQPFDAANLVAQRQLEQGKKDTAEQLYASGDLNTNAAQMASTQANERAATGLAGVKANLIANQLTQRANQLQQLYSLAVASGDSESARQVQLELASIQAELAREGYGVDLANTQANQNVNSTKPFLTA